MKPKPQARQTAGSATARKDRQEDDEFCTCCEGTCDCQDCRECAADASEVRPVKGRWTRTP